MPGKGRRVASRQAQLGRRRRKPARGGSEVSSSPAAVAESQTDDAVDAQPEPMVAPPRVNRDAGPVRPVTAGPQRAPRSRTDRPAAYNYVGAEVRRILIMSGILLVVLIVLAFVI